MVALDLAAQRLAHKTGEQPRAPFGNHPGRPHLVGQQLEEVGIAEQVELRRAVYWSDQLGFKEKWLYLMQEEYNHDQLDRGRTSRGRCVYPAREKQRADEQPSAHLVEKRRGVEDSTNRQTFGVSPATVSNVRRRYREGGVEGVLKDKAQAKRRQALDGAGEAVLVALACSPVPEGHDHWTLRMLRDQLVELGVVEGISAATIRTD
jgi:transposase